MIDLVLEFVGFGFVLAMLGVFLFGILAAIDPSKAADRRGQRREGTDNDL